MSNDFAQFMAKLAAAAGNEILVKAAEVEPPKVRRGRPRKPARVMIRLDRGGPNGMAYMVGDGPKRSLGITGDNMEAAEVSAQLRRMAAEAAAVGLYSPRQIPLEVIFEDYKKWAHPGPKGTVEQIRDHEQTCRRLNRVLKQMKVITLREDVRIGDIKPANCRAYDAWLQKQPVGKGENPQSTLSVGSSRMDLGFARAAVNRFAEEHVIAITNGFWVPERPEPRQNWLTRRQISRLLWICYRGYIWDETQQCWVTETVIDPNSGRAVTRRKVSKDFNDPVVRENFSQAARAILVLYYTGTRSTRACNLVWDEHPYKGWIDPVRGVIRRSGMRVGKSGGTKRKPKPAGTSLLPPALQEFARRWRIQDLREGHMHVFRKANGSEHDAGSLLRLIKMVGSRCGLGDIIVHEFRHSTVTQCLRAGCSIADTAAFVDMSEEMVRTTYGHIAEEATKAGALAMVDRKNQPRFTSRELAADRPRNLLTPQEAMAARKRIEVKVRTRLTTEQPELRQ
jgi:integrase